MEQREFEKVSAAALNLFPPLAKDEAEAALTLYRLLAHGEAVSIDGLARASGISKPRAEALVSAWSDAYRDAEGRIVGYGGLTVARTKHRLTMGGKALYTWCAWDTLFIPPLLDATAQVASTCPATGESLTLAVDKNGVKPEGRAPLVSFIAPGTGARADIVGHFCCHVHFVANAAGRRWAEDRPGIVLLTVDEAWRLGLQRNALRYPARQRESSCA
jgi:alkylmercury lyase